MHKQQNLTIKHHSLTPISGPCFFSLCQYTLGQVFPSFKSQATSTSVMCTSATAVGVRARRKQRIFHPPSTPPIQSTTSHYTAGCAQSISNPVYRAPFQKNVYCSSEKCTSFPKRFFQASSDCNNNHTSARSAPGLPLTTTSATTGTTTAASVRRARYACSQQPCDFGYVHRVSKQSAGFDYQLVHNVRARVPGYR